MSKKITVALACMLILCGSYALKYSINPKVQETSFGSVVPSTVVVAAASTKPASNLVLTSTAIYTSNYGVAHPKALLKNKSEEPTYLPYIQIGDSYSFGRINFNTTKMDLFIPIWQTPQQLLFTDIRAYLPNVSGYEGNFHVGYRQVSQDNKRLYGIYSAFDRKKSDTGGYFNQITFGVECWINNWFVGGNIYKPIGKTKVLQHMGSKQGIEQRGIYTNFWVQDIGKYSKAMAGADAEIGREFTTRLTGYLGGYYFYADKVKPIYGPKIKLTYDWSNDNDAKMFHVFDKIGLEAGLQYDKVRGAAFTLGIKLRIGLTPRQAPLSGVARHMVDLVRRDTDIVSNTYQQEESKRITKTIAPSFNNDLNKPSNIVIPSNPEASNKADRDKNTVKSTAMIVWQKPIVPNKNNNDAREEEAYERANREEEAYDTNHMPE